MRPEPNPLRARGFRQSLEACRRRPHPAPTPGPTASYPSGSLRGFLGNSRCRLPTVSGCCVAQADGETSGPEATRATNAEQLADSSLPSEDAGVELGDIVEADLATGAEDGDAPAPVMTGALQ